MPVSAPVIPDHELLRLIGRGSYGEVWLARSALGTFRAIKLVYRSSFGSSRPYEREFLGIQRFEPVSRSHEGLVDILQVGHHEQAGFFYYVMELADPAAPMVGPMPSGESIALEVASYVPNTLQHEIRVRGRLPISECVRWFRALAEALDFLHQRNLVHRDIKPANIVLVRGRPLLADVGLVTEVADGGSFVGTEGFIPPEGPGKASADIYSLGKVIYEAATGLDRNDYPSLPMDLLEGPERNSLLEINAIIARACAPQVLDRYRSAADLVRDLALLQVGRSVTQLRTLEARLRRARRFMAVAAGVSLIAMAGVVIARYQAGRERSLRQRAEAAEATGRTQLGEARLQQARALLESHEPDRRARALIAIRQAAGMAPIVALRNEAVAALALPLVKTRPFWTNYPVDRQSLAFYQGTEKYLEDDRQGHVRVRSATDGAVLEDVHFPVGIDPGLFSQTRRGRWRHRSTENHLIAWSSTNSAVQFAMDLKPEESFEFGPDEETIGHWRADGRFYRLTLPELRELDSFSVDRRRGDFRFSPDGGRIVLFGGAEKRVECWDVVHGRRLQTIDPGIEQEFLEWSNGGRSVCFSATDARAFVWEIETGRLCPAMSGHQSRIIDLGFFPDDDRVMTVSWDATTRFWEGRTGREILRLNNWGGSVVTDRATQCFGASQANNSRLDRHQFQPATVVRTFRQPFSCVDIAFSADEKYLVVAGEGIRVLSAETGAELARGGTPGTYRVWWDAADQFLVASEFDGVFRYRLERPTAEQFRLTERKSVGAARYSTKHPADVWRDGWAFLDGPLLQIHRQETNLIWEHRQESAETVAVSSDGEWIATGTRNHHGVRLWQARTGQLHWERELRWGSQVAFSPDSRQLASAGSDETAVWDVATGDCQWRLSALPEKPGHWHLNYSVDGRYLAVARTPYLVQLLDPGTGREMVTLRHALPEYISEIRFSGSGDSVAVVCESGAVQIWNLRLLRQELAALGLDWK